MSDDDLYRILQVDPDAEPEVIEAAYRALARKLHPDRNARATAQSEMARLNRAHEILSDPPRRALYDQDRLRLVARSAHAPYGEGSAPRRTVRADEEDRRGHWVLAIPLVAAALIGLVLLVAVGPLSDNEIEPTPPTPTAPVRGSRTGPETPTVVAKLGTASTETTPTVDARSATRDRLLAERDEASVEERETDVTGDGASDLMVLSRPAACVEPCTIRAILIIRDDGRSWVIENQVGAEIAATSDSLPGFEVFRPLTLQDDDPCCPTTASATTFRWIGDGFIIDSTYFEAVATEALTEEESVQRFYALLAKNRLLPAYGMFSHRFQQEHPFEAWSADQQSAPSLNLQAATRVSAGVVGVTLATSPAGVTPQAEQRVGGTWTLVQTPRGWRLDQSDIRSQP